MAISKIITSSLIDDAVTSAKIGTDQVGADALSSSAISGAVDIPANSVGQSELSIDLSAQSVPHIIPGVLQPAIAGKLLNGADHSGAYGTPQTQSGGDGHSYYYTDIKGSKPIKDPRIGAHFGSQRYRISSLQLLEQETATHGKDVFSIDGREWLRVVGGTITGNDPRGSHIIFKNGSNAPDGDFLEITGYFNKLNYIAFNEASRMGLNYQVNGGSATQTNDTQFTAVTSPLDGRYVNPMAVHTINIGTINEPGIYTVKLVPNTTTAAAHHQVSGIELIAQDTSNRNNIQIPSQNVVSFGKKFNVSGTPHYNPFNGYTATTSFSSVVDVDTSLGLEAWKHTDNNYYPPVNGGRVVKWVDSSGTIKTSVTLMPPNATGISSFSSNPRDPNYGSWSSQYQPTFKNETERQLHEVAKTFHFREFGNGSANGSASYADASTLNTANNVAYVMDDGLTSISGNDVRVDSSTEMGGNAADPGDYWYMTFIGTGITTVNKTNNPGPTMYCQNLPYGSHIIKVARSSSANPAATTTIDGVSLGDVGNNYGFFSEVSFYQPKRPPIPEDACVIADYMLMADYVPSSSSAFDTIDKGARRLNTTRDVFYDTAISSSEWDGYFFNPDHTENAVIRMYSGSTSSGQSWSFSVPAFSSGVTLRTGLTSLQRINSTTLTFNGANPTTLNGTIHNDGTVSGNTLSAFTSGLTKSIGVSGVTLGLNNIKGNGITDGLAQYNGGSLHKFDIATPIHTSSHYQSFETPFLHELVGGDRNMEQTNLVVSPDGKTWDQITRDTSYLGNIRCTINKATNNQGNSNPIIWDNFRGRKTTDQFENFMTKDFAIAYDRLICLVDGQYEIHYWTYVNSSTTEGNHRIGVNGQFIIQNYTVAMSTNSIDCLGRYHLKRGDYLQVQGSIVVNKGGFQITKV